MRSSGYSLCCVGTDGREDLFWFSQERTVTETVAREKFQHHAELIPPEIGLRLYAHDDALRGKRLVDERAGGGSAATANRRHRDSPRGR